jgi:hypothetical protein
MKGTSESGARPVPFAVIGLGIFAVILVIGFAGIFTVGAGAAPIISEDARVARAAPVFTPIVTPVPPGDPSGGRPLDRAVWRGHALAAVLFTIFIWGVVAAVVIGIVTTGRLKAPVVPGRPDIEAAGRR